MNNVTQIVQTVRQANWRVQRQWIGLFLLGLVLVAMVAGIYLNITVRATQAGREIQGLQGTMAATTLKNADDETTLAGLNAIESMKQRAADMGFQPAETGDITYVTVDGYNPPSAIDMSTQTTEKTKSIYLLPEYSESLLDWLSQRIAVSANTGVQP